MNNSYISWLFKYTGNIQAIDKKFNVIFNIIFRKLNIVTRKVSRKKANM